MTKLQSRFDFSRGHPNKCLLPSEEIRNAMHRLLECGNESNEEDEDDDNSSQSSSQSSLVRRCLCYGEESGSRNLKREIKSFLNRQTTEDETLEDMNIEEDMNKNDLFVTGGVSHGIELICRVFTQPGDVVWVERPTYYLVCNIFRNNNLLVQSLPMLDHHGALDIQQLALRLEQLPQQSTSTTTSTATAANDDFKFPRLIYIIPTHQNPTGRTMDIQTRKSLAQLAWKHNILLLADEVYHLLDWTHLIHLSSTSSSYPNHDNDNINTSSQSLLSKTKTSSSSSSSSTQRRPARMCQFNNSNISTSSSSSSSSSSSLKKQYGCCISVSSFTKIFAPGLRVGWIEAPTEIIKQLEQYGYIQSGGGVAPFTGDLLMYQILFTQSADIVLSNLQRSYHRRCSLLYHILQQSPYIQFPNGFPCGGYFLWVQFSIVANDFQIYCRNHDLYFRTGISCVHEEEEEEVMTNLDSKNGHFSIEQCARLCFADLDENDLVEGAKCLVKALDQFYKKEKTGHA